LLFDSSSYIYRVSMESIFTHFKANKNLMLYKMSHHIMADFGSEFYRASEAQIVL